MRTALLGTVVLLATACDLEQAQDTLEGLTNPLVMEAIVIGVEPPEDERISLEGSGFDSTLATVFLADARSVNDLENAPVTTATVKVNGTDLSHQGGGIYVVESGLTYVDNASWNVTAATGSGGGRAIGVAVLPPAPNVNVPDQHDKNTPLDVALGGQGFDNALIVVLDTQSGNVTWSNEPEGIKETYDFIFPDAGPGTITIPGDAFPDDSLYAVGVAGMVKADDATFENMNTVISGIITGKMKFAPVATAQIPDL